MEFQERVEEWLRFERNETTRKEVSGLWEEGDTETLKDRFGRRMSFGTAGLRAAIISI